MNVAAVALVEAAGPVRIVASGAVASYLKPNVAVPLLPAASLQFPETDAVAESGPLKLLAGSQLTPPDIASVPANETVSAAVYQPAGFAARDGVAVTAGAVASYLNDSEPKPMLPAASLQLPDTAAVAESGPLKVLAASQVTPPLIRSVPAKETVKGAVYQPAAFAARDSVAVTDGAVASYLNGNELEPTFPARSVQLPETDAVAESGPAYVWAAVQVTTLPESVPLAVKTTEARYQPAAFATRDGEIVTTGAVASYLKPNVAVPLLPAASLQFPETDAVAESGPL